MKITLPNGLICEGDLEQIIEVANKLGCKIPSSEKGNETYYYSTSKCEFVKIADMALPHIKNALLKLYREWTSDLSDITDYKELCMKIHDGPTEPVYIGLIKELVKKVSELE